MLFSEWMDKLMYVCNKRYQTAEVHSSLGDFENV